MILIVGPNGVGKTRFAYDYARKNRGEIINLDRTYLYRGFPLTTGLQDTLKEEGVERHLYEMLDPDEDSFTAETFTEMTLGKAKEIEGRGRLAIAEGGSTIYVPALLELDSQQKIFDRVLGLRFAAGFNIEKKYRARIEQALEEGLTTEIQQNFNRYKNSFIIRECHFAVPIVSHLKGELSLDQAVDQILERCLKYQERQLELFSKFNQIDWIEIQ